MSMNHVTKKKSFSKDMSIENLMGVRKDVADCMTLIYRTWQCGDVQKQVQVPGVQKWDIGCVKEKSGSKGVEKVDGNKAKHQKMVSWVQSSGCQKWALGVKKRQCTAAATSTLLQAPLG